MANYKAVSSGVWSALARWQDDSSGSYVASTVLPGAADVVYANNFTVTLDIDVVVSELRTNAATNVTAGGLFDFGAGNSVTANLFSGSGSCVRNNTSNIKTITGNVLASTTSGINHWGVNNSSSGTLIINGNVTGGSVSGNRGAYNDGVGTTIINGIATGGSANACQGLATVNIGNGIINGIAIGGTGGNCAGVDNSGTGTITVNGTVIGGTSSVGASNSSSGAIIATKATASINNAGISNTGAGLAVITEAEDASNGRQACVGLVRYSNSGQLQHTVTRQNGTQQLLTDNSTVNYPVEADVRNLVQYGPGNIYTGTLVPDITPQDIFTAIANSSDPIAVRLRNVATVQTTGDQIAAAL